MTQRYSCNSINAGMSEGSEVVVLSVIGSIPIGPTWWSKCIFAIFAISERGLVSDKVCSIMHRLNTLGRIVNHVRPEVSGPLALILENCSMPYYPRLLSTCGANV